MGSDFTAPPCKGGESGVLDARLRLAPTPNPSLAGRGE
jgi:hypothetical protein